MIELFSNHHPLHRLEEKRQDLMSQNTVVPNYLVHLFRAPYPAAKENSNNMNLTVIDIETSGLNPETDHIVSIGWVHIINNVIKLNSAQHHIINEPPSINTAYKGEKKDHSARSLHHILPEQQKIILQLRDIEEYDFDEIAKMLDMNNTAVRVNLSRARKTIREKLTNTHNYGIN